MSDPTHDDKKLWAQLRRTAATPADDPEPETLAAYLEGRLDEAEAARIERWLADDPAARSVLLQETGAAEAPPAALVRRAQAAVPDEKRSFGWFGLGRLVPRPALLATACAVVIAFVGALELGASTHGALKDTEGRLAAALWSATETIERPS